MQNGKPTPGVDPVRQQNGDNSRLILELLPAAAYTCDRAGLITYFNKRAAELWGRQPKLNDVDDRYCGSFRLFSPDGAPIRHEECWMALALRENREYTEREIVIERPDGSRRFVVTHAGPLRDTAGRICGAANVLVDVTERKRMEDAIRNEEARKSAIFHSALDAIFILDPLGRIMEINSAAASLFGYDPLEIVGKPLAEVLISPPTRERFQRAFGQFLSPEEAIIADRRVEILAVRRDGSEIPAELTVTAAKPPARAPFFTVYLRDLTAQRSDEAARREAEERFAQFMRHLPAAAWIKDGEGRYTYANEYAQRIFGRPLDELRGKTDLEIFPPQRAAEFRENDRRARESGRAVQTIEHLEHKDDGIHQSVVTKFPIFGPAGEVIFTGGVAIDITEQRQAVQALKDSESKLQALLDNARACIFAKDLSGRYIITNRRMAELFGWPDERFALGKTDHELHSTQLADELVANDRKVIETGKPVEVEEVIQRTDGPHTFLVLKFPLRDAEARVYAVCGIASDITARKRAEEALRGSEERYRRLAELLPVGVYTCKGPEGTITYFNKQAVQAWGRSPEIGDTDERFCGSFRLFRPDGGFLPHEDCPMALALRDGSAFRNEEVIIEREDGSRTTVLVNIDPIRDATGNVVGAVNVFHDISAIKQVEQALQEEKENLRTLLETLPVAVLIAHDPECRRISGNAAAADLLRLRPGDNFSKTAPDGEQPAHFHVLKQGQILAAEQLPIQRAAKGEIVGADEVDHEFDDGTVIHTLVSARALYDQAGNPRGAVASILDITSAKKAEKALRDADRRKDEFLATLGHELRNPLAPIRLGLDLMKVIGDDPAKREQTRSMLDRQTRQLTRLVDDLLDVSRITRGKIELRKCRTNLTDVIESAVEASRPFFTDARQELSIDLPGEEIILDGDPNRLAQILSNLLNNASKFTPEGGRVWLTVKRERDEVNIAVKDTGAGVPGDSLECIFDMFTQLDGPEGAAQAGLGIGLTLAKVLVEMHGGDIEVSSEGAGKGSTFTVRLPGVGRVPDANKEIESQREQKPANGKRRVLIVDDNEAAAETLGMVVEMLGHEVRTAGNGREAVAVTAEFLPDMVVMDLGMPVMDGFEAARQIRQQPRGEETMLVALSGWGQEEHKERALEAGFDRHLVKPAGLPDLQRLFSELDEERGRRD